MDHLVEFFGRLHPAIVHLPIGILLLFSPLVWFRKKINITNDLLTLILAVGALTALISVATGLVLSSDDEYNSETVSFHKWMGVATAFVSTVCWLMARRSASKEPILKFASALIAVLVLVTGHVGGDLVRGSSYLLEPLSALAGDEPGQVVFEGDIAEAMVYADIIQPILKSKCYSCHGEEKQKGKLRLDLPDLILKGGKHGEVIVAGDGSNSDLIMRVNLPEDDDDHMPPKEKKQLSPAEIAWLTAWIEHGADFTRKAKDVIEPETLAGLMSAVEEDSDEYSGIDVSEADDALISDLISQGVAISPIAEESHLLQVNMVSVPAKVDSLLGQVALLGHNVVSLKLGSTHLTDQGASSLGDFPNLRWLALEDTKITDVTIGQVATILRLRYLNLNGTSVTASSLEKLSGLKELKSLFLYHTAVTPDEARQLQVLLPSVKIEVGGYHVPMLPTDTVVLKPREE
jgi:uncharacterized membrane protein